MLPYFSQSVVCADDRSIDRYIHTYDRAPRERKLSVLCPRSSVARRVLILRPLLAGKDDSPSSPNPGSRLPTGRLPDN